MFPEEFRDLMPFSGWALSTERERSEKRISSPMEEISEFYGAVQPRIEAILEYLNQFDLKEMPGDQKHLMHLVLSFAEVATAVEWYDQPTVIDGFDRRRYHAVP